jgi:ureidoglycolate lyase
MRRAPLTDGAQGVNIAPGTWRGVLTLLAAPGLFAVIDRIGAIPNQREHRLRLPFRVAAD